MKLCVVLLFFTSVVESRAAFETRPLPERLAMGGTGTAGTLSPGAYPANPAGLATIPNSIVTAGYTPGLFGLNELERGTLVYIQPTGMATFSVAASAFGSDLYRETVVGIAAAREILPNLLVGLAFDFFHLSITEYGQAWTFGLSLGALAGISETLHWGFSLSNINTPAMGQEKEDLPQEFRTGLEYRPAPDVILALDVAKDIRYPAEVRLGAGYAVFDILTLRGGSSTNPSTFMAGIGVRFSPATLDYAFASHPAIGGTHEVSLTVDLGDL
jgi:hypothetical protein